MKAEPRSTLSESRGELLAHLRTEHQRLEERLREIDRNVYLTPDEQIERKRIQKLKLQAKDQLQRLDRLTG